MRWMICALAILAFAPRAHADDFDVLRGMQPVGPATFTNWSGFYFGGGVGYSDANADFTNATQTPIAYALRETTLENEFSPSQWPILGTAGRDGTTYGGFVGYNTQFQDVIVGIEADYDQTSLAMVAPSSQIGPLITPADSQGYTHTVTITGNGSMTALDYGSLRFRGGWVLGSFLPYGFAGLAIGQANYAVSANVQDYECNSATPRACGLVQFANSSAKNGALTYGFVAGLGLDVALTQNLFVRGELEFAQFAPIAGIVANIITARAGAGVKF